MTSEMLNSQITEGRKDLAEIAYALHLTADWCRRADEALIKLATEWKDICAKASHEDLSEFITNAQSILARCDAFMQKATECGNRFTGIATNRIAFIKSQLANDPAGIKQFNETGEIFKTKISPWLLSLMNAMTKFEESVYDMLELAMISESNRKAQE